MLGRVLTVSRGNESHCPQVPENPAPCSPRGRRKLWLHDGQEQFLLVRVCSNRTHNKGLLQLPGEAARGPEDLGVTPAMGRASVWLGVL